MTPPLKLTEKNEKIIARYKEAYRQANGREIEVTYSNKWFTLRTIDQHTGDFEDAGYPTSIRYKKLVEMCEVLEERKDMAPNTF